MIGYVTVGVKDIEAAKTFYTELFGYDVVLDIGRLAMIGESMASPRISVCLPYDKQAPKPGNGVMIAFPAGSKNDVIELYKKAIELGAICDGKPGPRIKDVFFGAYVKDPDGNKLCFYEFDLESENWSSKNFTFMRGPDSL